MKILLFVLGFSFTANASYVCQPLTGNCEADAASNLCRNDQDDYFIYDWASKTKDTKSFFFGWFDNCKYDTLTQLSTAVHETTHRYTSDNDAYPLIDGTKESFSACDNISAKMLKPKVIAPQFDKNAGYVDPYLIGDASSATDFCFLLDELNAYGHDLNTSVHLKNTYKTPAGLTVDTRAGLVALMSFLKIYADKVQTSDAKTWALMQGSLKPTIVNLWQQGAKVLESSCGVKDWGGEYFYSKLCENRQFGAIVALGGEVPAACSVKCLP